MKIDFKKQKQKMKNENVFSNQRHPGSMQNKNEV